MNVNELAKYNVADAEKRKLINDVLFPVLELRSLDYSRKMMEERIDFDIEQDNAYSSDISCQKKSLAGKLTKYCPKCGRRYHKSEIVCLECLVHLKDISDRIDVRDIESAPEFIFKTGNDFNDFEDLLSNENIIRINKFQFSCRDYFDILHNIKSQAFQNFDSLIKFNGIIFDDLSILDKVLLITKSFAGVKFKSYGGQLGYFEDNTIYIDDRQTDALQITSLLHELSHFLIKEILTQILCKILDASKSPYIEILSTYIWSYASFTNLIDEYCAHTVEGRFTIFGYQDYSSFRQIELILKEEMPDEEIEITKSIGNTFAIGIKDILESFLDRGLREEIKSQFKLDILDEPNYKELAMENCQKLTDEGFMKAVWLILNEGCEVAAGNIEKLYDLKISD
jgi:hypothetical protein